MRYFVRIRCAASPGQTPVDLQWRVVGVDRVWKRVNMPSAADCYVLMEQHVSRQLGNGAQIVLVDDTFQTGRESEMLHPDVLQEYRAAMSADALRGIRD